MSEPSESSPPQGAQEAEPPERLDHRLERGAVEIDEVVAIARMLAVHLDAEHEAGRIDGAIVPGRIEVREGGSPRLLSAAEEHRDQKAYMAPEAWITKPTPGSDQFAMAAVLYEALCGGRAFPGDDADKIRESITTGQRVPLAARVPGLVDAVDAVFARALSVDSSERYASCAAFAEALVQTIERSRDDAQVLVQKPASHRPGSHKPPPYTPEIDSWAPDGSAPIPWLKVFLALLALAIVAAALAVMSSGK